MELYRINLIGGKTYIVKSDSHEMRLLEMSARKNKHYYYTFGLELYKPKTNISQVNIIPRYVTSIEKVDSENWIIDMSNVNETEIQPLMYLHLMVM